jgi:hypothetical protein
MTWQTVRVHDVFFRPEKGFDANRAESMQRRSDADGVAPRAMAR